MPSSEAARCRLWSLKILDSLRWNAYKRYGREQLEHMSHSVIAHTERCILPRSNYQAALTRADDDFAVHKSSCRKSAVQYPVGDCSATRHLPQSFRQHESAALRIMPWTPLDHTFSGEVYLMSACGSMQGDRQAPRAEPISEVLAITVAHFCQTIQRTASA